MKIKILEDKEIGGRVYPKNAVIGVYQPEYEAWIADGTGVAVPDGTMARIAAYEAPGCVPQQKESNSMLRGILGGVSKDAKTDFEQKTNTLKK